MAAAPPRFSRAAAPRRATIKQVERIRGSALQAMRRRVAREQPLCAMCEARGHVTPWYPAGHLDHLVPLHQGGTNDRGNLVGLCRACHEAKTADEAGQRARGCSPA